MLQIFAIRYILHENLRITYEFKLNDYERL